MYSIVTFNILKEEKLKEGFGGVSSPPPFSSKEAKMVVDDALRQYSKDLPTYIDKVNLKLRILLNYAPITAAILPSF